MAFALRAQQHARAFAERAREAVPLCAKSRVARVKSDERVTARGRRARYERLRRRACEARDSAGRSVLRLLRAAAALRRARRASLSDANIAAEKERHCEMRERGGVFTAPRRRRYAHIFYADRSSPPYATMRRTRPYATVSMPASHTPPLLARKKER